jgi:predicted RNase H-like HicB family nuclease
MKTLFATIDRNKDGFSVYEENGFFSGMGNTADEAKQNMIESIEFYAETCKNAGMTYPSYLDGDYEVLYKFDIESLLSYYQGIFSNSALETLTGINQKQLWSYAHGKSKPRPAQVKKIEQSLHSLGRELISLSL